MIEIRNPYSNEIVGKIEPATREDIEKAMWDCYKSEKNLSAEERKKILNKAVEKIKADKEKLAKLISSESGLAMKDTLHEIDRVCDTLTFSANAVDKIDEDITSRFAVGENANPELKVVKEPMDLVIGITPFNHPMNQVAHKVGPAVAAGTAMVLKPSEKTPLSAIKLVEILKESGLPDNMLKVIVPESAEKFLEQVLSMKLAEMITFTGGVEIGKKIARKLAETGNEFVKYLPEAGGNSALVVLEDADIDKSAKTAMNAFANSGQRCTKIKRILLHNAIADEFIEKFVKLTEKIKYGDPNNSNTEMGTVISKESAEHIQEKVEEAIEDGAELLYGNKRDGALYSPTILDNVNPKSELVAKETFGPVAPIIRINSVEEAIEIINSVNYKLACGVMTKDKEKAEKIANAVKVGQFNWNNNPGFRTEQAPFGGFRDSGNGMKEGVIMAGEGMKRIRTFYSHKQ